MCSILHLKPGQMPLLNELENAVWNNWHSYGLVTMVDGKLDIKKKCPKDEVDPKEVWDLLNADKDYERFLHLRHNTAGATTLENTHPFEVYFNPKTGRHVVFMHNGTFDAYKSKKETATGTWVDDPDGPSDTKNFVDRVLIPYTSAMDFGSGKGDISNYYYRNLIRKFWSSVESKGVIIASDQEPFFIGTWYETDALGKGEKIKCSNKTYFSSVIRGPEFERRRLREEADKKKKEKDAEKNAKANGIVPLSSFDFSKKHGFYDLSQSMCHILSDWDFYDRANCVSLGYATFEELEELYKHKSDCLQVMDFAFTDYAKLYKEHEELQAEKDRATKKIAEFAEEIKTLKAKIASHEGGKTEKEAA